MALLTLIRHGQSLFNLQNRFTGELDVPLTEEGRQEAMRAGQQLQKLEVVYHAAFTSGLQRAQESLKIILAIIDPDHKISVVRSKALNERNYGVLQGRNKAEATVEFSADDVARWRRSYSLKPPGGESLEDTYHRVIPYFQSSIEPLLVIEKHVLIVAHGNSLRALVMYLRQISSTQIEQLEIATGIPLWFGTSYSKADAHLSYHQYKPY